MSSFENAKVTKAVNIYLVAILILLLVILSLILI